MKIIYVFAVGIVAAGIFATCAKAGPVEEYAAKRWAEGCTDAHQVRHELMQPVPVLSTNAAPARVRSQAERDLIALCVAQGITAAAMKAAPDRDALIDSTMLGKLNTGTAAQQNLAAVACAKIQIYRAAIARQGRALPAETADEPQPPVVSKTLGPPLWRVLGASEPPPLEPIAGAMK